MNAAIPAFRRRMPNVDGGTRERPPIHACHAATQLHRSVVLILVAHWKTVCNDSRILKIIRAFQRRLRASHQFALRSEEHTSELQSLKRHSYAVFCLKKK